jgi:uncharacterized protein YebE (UPF0316 family)
MNLAELFGGPFGPLLIFTLRIFDVSLATSRLLLSVRGDRLVVPIIGFFESLIWLTAVGAAVASLNSPIHVLAYAGGFAMGNVVGLWVEEKMALGLSTVRIISRNAGVELADALRENGFGVTEFAGHGREGMVEVVYTVVRRRQVPKVLAQVSVWDPDAFVTVESPKEIRRGWMLARTH